MKKCICVFLIAAMTALSCGTIMNGTRQEIRFTSSPRGATVIINGDEIGETPLYYDLKRNNSYNVTIELEGHRPYDTVISRRISGWALGNIVFFLLPGLAVDAISGGLYALSPEDIHARMRNEEASVIDTDEMLYITVVLKPEPHWKKIGQLELIR